MPVPTLITDLDTVANNNSPPGTESAKGNIDNYIRAHASFIKQAYNAAQNNSLTWAGTAGGTANALTLTLSSAITAIAAGQRFAFKSGASPNSAATTVAISGLTAIAVQVNGAACTGAEIAANNWYEILVDASLTSCQLRKIGRATLAELGAAASGANNDITQANALTSINGHSLSGLLNRIINGNFAINQRAVAGTVTLAAGAYGHDRWKAGAGGCTYTFAASGIDTIITISAGTLMQVVAPENVEGGVYRLSQQGTAQARIAVNGAATSGAYAANPQSSAPATANQAITAEFTLGTIDRVQLEPGTVATTFERRAPLEFGMCLRYAQTNNGTFSGLANSATAGEFNIPLLAPMRAVPTMTNLTNGTWVNGLGAAAVTGASLSTAFANGPARATFTTAGGMAAGQPISLVGQSVLFVAEL